LRGALRTFRPSAARPAEIRTAAAAGESGGSRERGDVENFKIEGTTLLSWTSQIQAPNEREAREEAHRLAGWIDLPSSLATFHRREHRIAVIRLADQRRSNPGSPA
jgi:hypothetical protein